ncbi:hypothetical protein LOC54_08650 [Acetobacter sp. AN02]|uniref:hypothetical protein n=1 Tax=Acetobacter sp. AN02 TaxID=2894186 RepID=UPI00243454A4|nr:hypothetical protein [Acetobacter sp. AN02]MDG6095172.1 hypothetical protein [Acetobacter sp. AN02]
MAGAVAAARLLTYSRAGTVLKILLFSLIVSITNIYAFSATLSGLYPGIRQHIQLPRILNGLLIVAASSALSAWIFLRTRRSIRNVIISGSLLACGMSCSVFSILAEAVRPFVLAYDLRTILITVVIASLLSGCSLRELDRTDRTYHGILFSALLAVILIMMPISSIGSILPFGEWMSARAGSPQSPIFFPVTVIAGSELLVILLLTSVASLLISDSRAHSSARSALPASGGLHI